MEKENHIFNQIKPGTKPKVPEFYFESLQKELNSKIELKQNSNNSNLTITLLSVASVAAIFLFFFFSNLNNETVEIPNTIANIETEVLDVYINSNIENFDDELFVESGYIAVNQNTEILSFENEINSVELDAISDYLSDDQEFEIEDY